MLQAKYKDQTSYVTTPNITMTDVGLHEYTNSIGTINYVTIPVAQANQEIGYPGRASAISGYDVTTNTTTFNIPYQASNNQFKIHADAGETVEQDWIFKLNFINYEWDQADVTNANNNNNKTFNGKVVFTKVTCAEPIVYKYWNDGMSGTTYTETSMPNNETKTAPEGRTYGSRELLASAYSNFSDNPVYIRTATQGGEATGHEACLYYNNREFCIGPNYWTGTIGTQDETVGANTKAKLKADMEAALGVTIENSSCNSDANSAYCSFGLFNCSVDYDGYISCRGVGYCSVNSGGSASCI